MLGCKKKICRELIQIDNCLNSELKLNKVLKFVWVPSEMLPADVNSKSAKCFTPPDLFLYGPPVFRNDDLVDNIYATFTGKFEKGKDFKYWNKNTNLSLFVQPDHFGDYVLVHKHSGKQLQTPASTCPLHLRSNF